MVTVIATGFNKKVAVAQPKPKPAASLVDRIPSGPADLQKYDEPTFRRKGIELPLNPARAEEEKEEREKGDSEKPAFLRKIMD